MKGFTACATILLSMTLASAAAAKPEFLRVLLDTYKPYAVPLAARACANCHVSESDFARNPYGKEIERKLREQGRAMLTPDILHSVEGLDAVGDGKSNLARIEAGLPPGGAQRIPSARSSTPVSIHTGRPVERAFHAARRSWIPEYAYHPLVVHFPIALFIAGLALDFLGLVGNHRTLLYAGWYNLVLAAIGALAAVATGLTARMLLKIPLTGMIRLHFLLAVSATVGMWILVALRVHRHERMNRPLRLLYYVLAAACLFLISYAGHLGGVFVYGE
jgi:uncharacterized membrane protein